MNTQGSPIQLDNHFHLKQNEDWDERKIRAMEEEVELLREQVESLKREQQSGYELTYECLQELAYTNKEVELMNEEIYNLINSKRLPSEQAKKWAHSIVKKNASVSDSLAELLSAIYRYPINLNEAEKIQNPIFTSKVDQSKIQSCEIRAKSAQIITRSSEITDSSTQITARSREIRACARDAKAQSREVRNQLSKEKISYTASKIVKLSDAIDPWGDRELGA